MKGFEGGGFQLLNKPLKSHLLLNKIRDVLDGSQRKEN